MLRATAPGRWHSGRKAHDSAKPELRHLASPLVVQSGHISWWSGAGWRRGRLAGVISDRDAGAACDLPGLRRGGC